MKITSIITILLLFMANAWAQEMPGEGSGGGGGDAKALQQAQAGTTAAIQNLIAGYGKERRNTLFTLTPRIGLTIGYGQGQQMIMKSNQSALIPYAPDDGKGGNTNQTPLDKQATITLLTATGTAIQQAQRTLNNAICAKPAGANPGGIAVAPAAPSCGFMDTPETVNNYDITSLLGPLGYPDSRTAQTALNYINFASNLAQPYPADLPDLLQANSNNLLPYLTAIRSYAAAQSVGLSNLYQIYVSRVRIPGLGGRSGLSSEPGAPASPLEVEEYNAKRRIVDREWYNRMETASPATIARETLYLQAEMLLENYKLRRAIERLIATNSVMQLQLGHFIATSDDGLPALKKKVLPPPKQ